MAKSKILTQEKFWDQIWGSYPLPQVFKGKNNLYYVERLDDFFHKHLPENKQYEFLELGCAPGRWMHYFHVEFGYATSGLDSSQTGMEVTKRNLELLNVNANLYFGDVLNYSFDKKYDVVFSIGLIEHFNPPTEIIEKHINLTKEGGYTVIAIPNIKYSLYYYLQKIVKKEVLENHVLLNKRELQEFFNQQSIIACQYVGVFNLFLLNIEQNSLWFKIICHTEGIAEKILRLLKITNDSHMFSPYIFIILKKN